MNTRSWLTLFLLPFSWLYGFILYARNWCYDSGIFHTKKIPVPVIAVGNITTGGTGKTPFVEYLLRWLLQRDKRIAVVSRGYKRSTKGTFIVSDGIKKYGSADQTGDEPMQLALKFPDVAVVVDENRVRGSFVAVQQSKPDVIILDDGFQHRAIERDCNILMIDGTMSLSDTRMIPAGKRREPLSSLRRADMTVVSRTAISPDLKKLVSRYSSAPMASVRFQPKKLVDIVSHRSFEFSEFQHQRCLTFSGIGNPESFVATVSEAGFTSVDCVQFPDHHRFSDEDIQNIKQKALDNEVMMIITTEKDAVRIAPELLRNFSDSIRLFFIEIEAVVTEGEELLHDLIESIFVK